MGMEASVTITFYDSDGKKIYSEKLDCYKVETNCDEFKIPKNSASVKICFNTEYSKCEECSYQNSDVNDNSDENNDDYDDDDNDNEDNNEE